jgi:hypothetical protein
MSWISCLKKIGKQLQINYINIYSTEMLKALNLRRKKKHANKRKVTKYEPALNV